MYRYTKIQRFRDRAGVKVAEATSLSRESKLVLFKSVQTLFPDRRVIVPYR